MTARRKTLLGFAGLLVLCLVAILSVLPSSRGGVFARALPRIRLGLDLQGGTQLIYEANMADVPDAQRADALEGVRDVLERRVNAFGISEPIVQVFRGGSPRVIVELAGIHDVETAIREIGETPQLDFREEVEPLASQPEAHRSLPPSAEATGGTQDNSSSAGMTPAQTGEGGWKRTDLTGRVLKHSDVIFHPQTGQPQVSLQFDGEGKRLFEELTKRNVGKRIAIFLDGVPITAPVVEEAITGGEAVITGTFTIQESKQLATRLNAGALPVPISLASRTTVGPSLGKESLAKSIAAGALGLLLLTIIMLVLYRLPGLIALLALAIYGLLLAAILQVLGATLTLAGVAGIILSFGMAVDANILIFESVKQELRRGALLARALTEGFREAWPSIRDSNSSSLITAALLYFFGSSVVKGFATTLAIGIVVSIFSGIVVTRMLLRVVVLFRAAQSSRLYVPPAAASRAAGEGFPLLGRSRLWLGLSSFLVLGSIAAIAGWGLRPGIDFTGGSFLELRGEGVSVRSVRTALERAGAGAGTVQEHGAEGILVRLPPLSTEEHADLLKKLRTENAAIEEARFETVGPTIGRELLRKALLAVALAVVLILGYHAIAFPRATGTVSPWAFGAIAVIAVVHDLLIMAGVFAVLARYGGASADSLFLTAALTLLGFSVHDTIVVFNRVKSNLARLRLQFADLVHRSVLETLTRSLNTSASTLFVLLALLVFGGSTIQAFVLTLSVGIVVGAYSSIFVASPLLIFWQQRRSAGR